jgi:hypothetical protein
MSNGFNPGQGGPLAPPGFERKDPRPGSPDYVARHPTRYDWREDIEELIRLIYRRFGGPDEQEMNTYVNHPPNPDKNGQSIWLGFDTQQLSLDVWGPTGRGEALPLERHRDIYKFLFNLDGAPDWWWAISRGAMWVRNRDVNLNPRWEGHIEDAPGGPPDSDPDHERHIHLTLLHLEDQLILRPNYTIRKGVERLRRM